MPKEPKDPDRRFDSQGDITDADIANYVPTPKPEVGQYALRRVVEVGAVALGLALAIGGGKSIVDTLHNNPHNGDKNPPRAHS